MKYYLQRLLGLARSLGSPRGMLVGLTIAFGVVGLFVEGSLKELLVTLAVLALAAALLLGIRRQSEQHQAILEVRRDVSETEARLAASIKEARAGVRSTGPRPNPRVEARVQEAVALVNEIRAKVGLELAGEHITAETPAVLTRNEDSPSITVVVPMYNEQRFVGETLMSVIGQTYADWECIVVDDASTDGSLAEAWRYAQNDERIRVIRHKVNSGLPASRNTGLRAAKGRFIAFLDADDLFLEHNLMERIEALAGTGSEVAGSYSGVIISSEDVQPDTLPTHAPWGRQPVIDFISANGECPFNAHAPLLRTDVVRAHAGFDESMTNGAEDWDLWLRVLRSGYVFVPCEHRLAVYRQKRASMAKTLAAEHVEESKRLISASYAPARVGTAPLVSHPFPDPLPVYQQRLTEARRAIQFAATSLGRGDVGSARSILDGLPDGFWPVLERRLDIDLLFINGFRRAYGFTEKEIEAISSELEPLRLLMRQLVREASSGAIPQLPAAETRLADVLFVPQNAVQAGDMLEVASTLGSSVASVILSTERITGAQGVEAVVAKSHLPVVTLDRWALEGCKHASLVVSFPFDAAVRAIVDRTVEVGRPVFHLRAEGEEVLRSEDAPEAPSPQHTVASLVDALRDMASGPVARVADPMALGPLLWQPSVDDPDAVFAIEEYPHTLFDGDDLRRFEGIHEGQRCVIIGNGPSLNELDLKNLTDEYTIGVNGIFYAADSMGYDLTYYVVEDTMVVRDNLDAIRSYRAGHKFFPSIYRDQIGEAQNISYFMMNRGFYAHTSPAYCVPRFSIDPGQRLYSGQSVTIMNLQLAYFMGFKEIVLIGMDFSYEVPADAKVDGNHILSMGDDPNHFHPDYFGKGKIWKDPKLDRVLANYQMAKNIFEADGRQIINATPGGKLDLFPRASYDSLFGS